MSPVKSVKKVLLLGATSYIGGELLYKLLTAPEFANFQITIITRCYEKARQMKNLTNGRVRPVVGSTKDAFLMYDLFNKTDIVINAADIEAEKWHSKLYNVASRIQKPYLIIHTSGASVLGDGVSPAKGPLERSYTDLKNLNKAPNNLPNQKPQRPVDTHIASIQDANPEYVKSVTIAPPTIFGTSDGLAHRESIDVFKLVGLAMANRQAFTTQSGNYNWSHVHVEDLANLYINLLSNLIQGNDIKTGRQGYYFAENGIHYWKDSHARIARLLNSNGIDKSDQVAQLRPEKFQKLNDESFAPLYWGKNKSQDDRTDLAISYGWEPKFNKSDLLRDQNQESGKLDLAIDDLF